MSITDIIAAINELPDNLIYVDSAGRIQAVDLKELAAAYAELLEAAKAVKFTNEDDWPRLEAAIKMAESHERVAP